MLTSRLCWRRRSSLRRLFWRVSLFSRAVCRLWWSRNIKWTRPTMYSEDLEYILWTLPFLKRFSMEIKARWWTAKPEIVTISFNSCWLFVMYLRLEPKRSSKYTWRIVKGLVDWSKGWFLILAGTEKGILSEFKGIFSRDFEKFEYEDCNCWVNKSTASADTWLSPCGRWQTMC